MNVWYRVINKYRQKGKWIKWETPNRLTTTPQSFCARVVMLFVNHEVKEIKVTHEDGSKLHFKNFPWGDEP